MVTNGFSPRPLLSYALAPREFITSDGQHQIQPVDTPYLRGALLMKSQQDATFSSLTMGKEGENVSLVVNLDFLLRHPHPLSRFPFSP